MHDHSFPHTAAKGLQCVNLRTGINFLFLPITIHMDVISSVYQIVAKNSDFQYAADIQ